MIWAYLALNVLAVLAAAFARYDAAGLAHAGPIAMGRDVWLGMIAGVGALCIVANLVGRKRLRRTPHARRALVELMLLPAAFILVWAALPARTRDYPTIAWTCIALLIFAMGLSIWRDPRRPGDLGLTGRNFRAAAGRLALPTAFMVAAPIVTALFVGTDFEPQKIARVLGSLAGYPVYALVQLLVFQVFLVPRLARLSESKPAVITVAAALFALAHWPNPLVMVVCGGAAGLWTWVYLARPNVYALALSMALAATSFSQALPHDLTHHVRVGPMYVFRASQHADGGR